MAEYTRRVLLAVAGLSPQVLTETLYALATDPKHPWIPTEIHLITTGEGRKRAELALLSKSPGWFHRLLRDYRLPPVAFEPSHIHVITDWERRALDDIRTPADNERAADYITEMVRQFTAEDDSALHLSIAGGRKTMGYYLGYALSLFGREQDRLSHVLVSEPFESSWNFFYPTPYSQVIETRDGSLADTRDAIVTLAEIPFVSLRHGLPASLLEGRSSFSQVVAAARNHLAPPCLVIDLRKRCIRAGATEFRLPPVQLAFYTLFARRALKGEPPLPAPPKEVPDEAWRNRFLAEYRLIRGEMDDTDRTEHALRAGMDGDYFSEKKSALHRSLKKVLGSAASPYLIDDNNSRPRRYRLTLPPDAIRIEGENG